MIQLPDPKAVIVDGRGTVEMWGVPIPGQEVGPVVRAIELTADDVACQTKSFLLVDLYLRLPGTMPHLVGIAQRETRTARRKELL